MSPEQMRTAKGVDVRTDVWSLGVSLFELVTGHVPFAGASVAKVVSNIMSSSAPSPATYPEDIPAGFPGVLARSLERDRARRYASVAEFAAAIAPFGPVSAQEAVGRIFETLGSPRTVDAAAKRAPSSESAVGAEPPGAPSVDPDARRRVRVTRVSLVVLAGILVAICGAAWLGVHRSLGSAPGAPERVATSTAQAQPVAEPSAPKRAAPDSDALGPTPTTAAPKQGEP
jgi:serine/threonine-protein kinase